MPTPPPQFPQLTDASEQQLDLRAAAATVAETARSAGSLHGGATVGVTTGELVEALVLLHRLQNDLATIEPLLIAAARRAGVSWQTLAPALGVASRQAAERRYLRLAPAAAHAKDGTGEDRVRAERDRRAGHRAVAQWANDHTADLRRLAGQVTGLTDLDDDAAEEIARLHHALADTDASALPTLLANARQHLQRHPDLADQITTVTAHTEQVRRDTQHDRDRGM